ncbi:hypothetical protein [Neisseria sicca]|uniref:hypothetical protein n=1 Tax=Neisseria sicca TaxID=490 RepID=UPI0034D957FB
MPRLAVLSVLSVASSPCPDLNLIHYKFAAIACVTVWLSPNPRCQKRSSENLKPRFSDDLFVLPDADYNTFTMLSQR